MVDTHNAAHYNGSAMVGRDTHSHTQTDTDTMDKPAKRFNDMLNAQDGIDANPIRDATWTEHGASSVAVSVWDDNWVPYTVQYTFVDDEIAIWIARGNDATEIRFADVEFDHIGCMDAAAVATAAIVREDA